MVFNHFVFHDAHTRLGDRHFGQRNAGISGGQSGGAEDFVYLLLRETRVLTLGFFDARNQRV
ncbi:hypothetical protein SVZ_N_04218 [Salmonella enterica subsp. enterica serovar Typhimurium]|nr:hypothetical protein NGUA38_00813 [Salmonella enterica]CAB3274615.1 hypothetical protein SVZ_N_04218 [Salmonella enterica subsp. enterica serovar Typhimurium]